MEMKDRDDTDGVPRPQVSGAASGFFPINPRHRLYACISSLPLSILTLTLLSFFSLFSYEVRRLGTGLLLLCCTKLEPMMKREACFLSDIQNGSQQHMVLHVKDNFVNAKK